MKRESQTGIKNEIQTETIIQAAKWALEFLKNLDETIKKRENKELENAKK